MRKSLEPELVQSWLEARMRQEITMAKLCERLDCDEPAATALLDAEYKSLMQALAAEKRKGQKPPKTWDFDLDPE